MNFSKAFQKSFDYFSAAQTGATTFILLSVLSIPALEKIQQVKKWTITPLQENIIKSAIVMASLASVYFWRDISISTKENLVHHDPFWEEALFS